MLETLTVIGFLTHGIPPLAYIAAVSLSRISPHKSSLFDLSLHILTHNASAHSVSFLESAPLAITPAADGIFFHLCCQHLLPHFKLPLLPSVLFVSLPLFFFFATRSHVHLLQKSLHIIPAS